MSTALEICEREGVYFSDMLRVPAFTRAYVSDDAEKMQAECESYYDRVKSDWISYLMADFHAARDGIRQQLKTRIELAEVGVGIPTLKEKRYDI